MHDLNPTGIQPTEYNVLVEIRPAAKQRGSILLTDGVQQRDQALEVHGRIVASSPQAFDYAEWTEENPMPQPGDFVIIAKGSGLYLNELHHTRVFRLLKDKDVAAIVDPEKAFAFETETKEEVAA